MESKPAYVYYGFKRGGEIEMGRILPFQEREGERNRESRNNFKILVSTIRLEIN